VLIVFINTLVHEAGIPLPLTPTVLLAGAATSAWTGVSVLVLAIVAGTLIGNSIWFAAGRRFGGRVLSFLCRISLSPDRCVGRTGDAFGRWGGALLVVGRFIPGVSLVAPPLAGALGMPWWKFLLLSALGTAVWAALIVLLGAALQEALEALLDAVVALPAGAWIAASGVVAGYILWRVIARRRATRELAVPRLLPQALRAALESAEPPVVIDVRGRTLQQIVARRIPGAITLPLNDLKTYPLEGFAGRKVVLYCACPNEVSAAAGAQILRSRGHAQGQVLLGGLQAWIDAGYELEAMI
jgi:membrane protein DedA with SNARE-associated domain/rhodanese-related sulfurtransferase